MPNCDLISKFFLNEEMRFISSRPFKQGHCWTVEKKRSAFEICPKCASPCFSYAGKAKAVVRESGIQNEALWLEIHKHRFMCKTCKKPFTESVKGIYPKRKTTQRFRKTILEDCRNFVNLSQVSKQKFCSTGFVYEVFYEQIEVKLRERIEQRWPKVLGIDEHFFSRKKGYREFVTIFTNLGKGKLFEVALGRDKKGLMEQLKEIPGRYDVSTVCIDMSGSYRSFVKEMFPNAKIVADKFHVLRLPTPDLIRVRREIHGHRQDLQRRKLLLRNRENLEYFERSDLDFYLRGFPDLNEIYTAKERLHQLYRTKGKNRAEIVLEKLIELVKKSNQECLQRLGRTLTNWKKEILEYFEHKVTNGLTEVTNRSGKQLQMRACGYKSFKNYRLAYLSACTF